MADEQVNQSLFTWIISTLSTGIFAGLAWLGIHTKRLNELNTKIEVAAQREKNRDEKISEIQTTIKEIKFERKNDMAEIREKWDRQIESHNNTLLENQKLSSCLISYSETMNKHAEQIELLERNVNFKVNKK